MKWQSDTMHVIRLTAAAQVSDKSTKAAAETEVANQTAQANGFSVCLRLGVEVTNTEEREDWVHVSVVRQCVDLTRRFRFSRCAICEVFALKYRYVELTFQDPVLSERWRPDLRVAPASF